MVLVDPPVDAAEARLICLTRLAEPMGGTICSRNDGGRLPLSAAHKGSRNES